MSHSDSQGSSRPSWPDVILNAGGAVSLAALSYGAFNLLGSSLPLLPNAPIVIALGVSSMFIALLAGARGGRIRLEPWAAVLTVVLASDVVTRWPTPYHGGLGHLHLALAAVAGIGLLGSITPRVAFLWWMLAICAAYLGLQEQTRGMLLFSDDHPSFLHRLLQLKAHFPAIPFYNPMWNGGVEAREFFPSGMLNFFFILYPLIFALDLTVWYTDLIALLYFLVHPLATYLAVRALRLEAPFAPVIALFSSALWFRHQFVYGTPGFLTSAALAPLVVALLLRAAEEGPRVSWRVVAGLLVSGSLCLLWSASVFIIAPVLLVLLPGLARFLMSRRGLVFATAFALVNLPWILIFIEASRVFHFIGSPQSGEHVAAAYPGLRTLLGDARYALQGTLPAVVLLSLPGLVLMRRRSSLTAVTFGAGIGGLFLIGLFAAPLKPRLELGRMIVVAIHLCAIPAGVAIGAIIEEARHGGIARRVLYGASVGSVLLIPAVSYVYTANRTLEQYAASAPQLPAFVRALQEHNGGGRVAFSGYLQHELYGGHAAPLTFLSGVPLYATGYQHDRWAHHDFIPTQFRKEHDIGIEKFFELYNITAIASADPEWGPWMSVRPQLYTQVWSDERFKIFKRTSPPGGWLLEGEGQVLRQGGAELRLRLKSPSAILRFNWLPFLQVEGCTGISPATVYEGIQFIRIEGCDSSRDAVIRAKPAWKRVME